MRLSEIEPGEKRKIGPHDPKINLDKIWDKLIVPNCSQSINSCKTANRFMFRGFNSIQPIVRSMSRNNRVTLNSDSEISAHFDKMLKALGFTALRSNSIFVTSNLITANFYGTPYIIFPINGYDFTYTWYTDLTFTPDEKGTLGSDWMESNDPQVFKADMGPSNTNIERALKNGYEIYIHGQYYALKYDIYGEQISQKLGIRYNNASI